VLIATALNKPIRLVAFYRTAIFVPFVASAAATGILANFVFNPQFGLANNALRVAHLPQQEFLESGSQALLVICLIALWGEVGFTVVVYLAALQDIPREITEAAMIDGASSLQVFCVTLPQLAPVTVFVAVWQTITALQLFDLVFTTTRGDRWARPRRSSTTSTTRRSSSRTTATDRPSPTSRSRSRCSSPWAWSSTPGAASWRPSDGDRSHGHRPDLTPQVRVRRRNSGPVRLGWLPFSPWHLFLMPTALLFLLPLLQMVSASFMTDAEINRFPPRSCLTACMCRATCTCSSRRRSCGGC
jgi:ABC-type glycerol-3-phosphate transport system permease component